MMTRIWRFLFSMLTAGSLAGALFAGSTSSALAEYGRGAAYQIEISDNCNGRQDCQIAKGAGIWLWIELDTDGTGDYTGSDCVHGLQTPIGTINGATSDRGDVTWSSSGGTITIDGVYLNGPGIPVTITVPSQYGHYQEASAQVFPSFPAPGRAQVQVAP